MQKISSILAVVSSARDAAEVMNKAAALGQRLGARVEVMDTQAIVSRSARPGDTALRRVESSRPDLVIKIPAGAEGLRRFTSHDTDWEFARECPVPVLLVRGRPWGNPLRFVAPVDVADEDEAALVPGILRAAGRLSMETQGEIDILYSEREAQDEALRMRRAVRLAQLVRQAHIGGGRLQMFSGEPARRLPPLVAARRYDVLVLGGASRREGLVERMPVRLARLLEATDSDALLLGTALAAAQVAPGSGLQHGAHHAQQLA